MSSSCSRGGGVADCVPAGRAIQTPVSTPDQVAGETKKRKRRKRTRNASVIRRINAIARERQEAWADDHTPTEEERRRIVELGQRDFTRALTSRLVEGFEALRREALNDERRPSEAGAVKDGGSSRDHGPE